METLAHVAFFLAVIAYSVASTLYFFSLAKKAEDDKGQSASVFLGVGAGLHLVHIVTSSFFTKTCPVESMRFALSLAAWVAVAAFLVLRRGRRIDALGGFVGPLALTFLVTAQFVGISAAVPEVSRALLALHITANILGIGIVLLAGGTAGLYVYVETQLKKKRLTSVGRLPSLDTLDRLGHRLLLLGFPLLTFGVVTGGLFVSQLDVTSISSVARAFLGYAAWLAVALVLVFRALVGWNGRRSAYGILAGVLCVSLVLVVYLLRPFLGGVS
jgi:ABC-type uncharacterized transport system permease subunit